MLDVGRRTWKVGNGDTLVSMFSLTSHHMGWPGIIHGGITSGIFDDIFAHYCHIGTPELFPLTKKLEIDFVQPTYPDEVLYARITKISPPEARNDTEKRSKKLWVQGDIDVVRSNEIVTLARAKALFILCQQLPEPPKRDVLLHRQSSFKRIPQELRGTVTKHLSLLTGRRVAHLLKFGIEEQHQKHSAVWNKNLSRHHINTAAPAKPTATGYPALHAKVQAMELTDDEQAGLERTAAFEREGNTFCNLTPLSGFTINIPENIPPHASIRKHHSWPNILREMEATDTFTSLPSIEIMQKGSNLFLGRRSLAPRPLSAATEFEDFGDEEYDSETSASSMQSLKQDCQSSLSSPDGPRTPQSNGLGSFDFYFDDKSVTGPHLFCPSPEPMSKLNMVDGMALPKTLTARPFSSLNRAEAELDESQVRDWTPAQVANWISDAGFDSSVVEKFLTHDVSGTVLLDLQFEDLKELEITSYGNRHRVMSSIWHLRNSSMISLEEPITTSPATSGRGQREQQKKIVRLEEEFATNTEPSIFSSSDSLSPTRPLLSPKALEEVKPRNTQEFVQQFLDFQHVHSSASDPSPPPAGSISMLSQLYSLLAPTIPHRGVTSPADIYRVGTPSSATDIPVTSMSEDLFNHDVSQLVPPEMGYCSKLTTALTSETIQRRYSTSSRRHGRPAFTLSIAPVSEAPSPSPTFRPEPPVERYKPEDVQRAGWMRKRRTTRLLRHEWEDYYFHLKGTKLEMHADETGTETDKALEVINVDKFAIVCSSMASSSKLSAAFKRSILGSGKGSTTDQAFAFSLIPEGDKAKNAFTQKAHHFSVKTRGERMKWMRDLMLARALHRSKVAGNEVRVNGNLI
jgi:SAM domain (Sterile alpha motif)